MPRGVYPRKRSLKTRLASLERSLNYLIDWQIESQFLFKNRAPVLDLPDLPLGVGKSASLNDIHIPRHKMAPKSKTEVVFRSRDREIVAWLKAMEHRSFEQVKEIKRIRELLPADWMLTED